MQQPDLAGFGRTSDRQRLFFALMPDPATRLGMGAAVEALAGTSPLPGHRSDPRRYHMTLQFLGEFDDLPKSLLDAACAAAGTLRREAFDLSLDQAGSFESRSSQLWWLGCRPTLDGLLELWRELGRSLARHGVRVQSGAGFMPHVTIWRGADRPPSPSLAPDLLPLGWRIDRFALVSSTPGARDGYRVLGEWVLAGRE